MTIAIEDPLRDARRAVRAGRFRDAWEALSRQPAEVRRSAEWHLLAAMARWRLGDFQPSRVAALQARDAYRAQGDIDGEMRAENVAAAGAFALGELDEAEAGFSRALSLAERLGDDLMLARCANNLGNVAFYRGQHRRAQAFYRLAQALFERVGMRHGVAETWINLGIVSRELNRVEESREAAERALEIAEQIPSPRLSAQALIMRGEALALSGDTALGRTQVLKGLETARAEEDPLAEIEGLRILGELERRAGNRTAAQELLDRALALAEKLGHTWSLAEVEGARGDLLAELGRREEALAAWARSAAAYERIGAGKRAARMRELARGRSP
ncbi:MAG: hypothetical protein KatS3mg081_2475 [Gemmatimonadales bacterium]|nr:MAG: hypothetical protein KatS3mg081_2475 [Gemmatimonadales bacterium]